MNPSGMTSTTSEEALYPTRDLSNYASWYRHLSQEQPSVAASLVEYLKPIISGFVGFPLTKEGETTRVLRAEMRNGSDPPARYSFDELSDGQRVLAGLYTLLALMKLTPITLCIDEPDNFVALPELQPWLMELQDQVEAHGSQVLVVSHHPELINYLVPHDAIRFTREPEGPVRVVPFASNSDEPLTAAEIVARGWEDG
jgi:predicted ATPase